MGVIYNKLDVKLLPKLRGKLSFFSGALINTFAGYSTRRINQYYQGPAIRVRRSSDNAETSIGFNALGELDTVSLLAFCGAGDGYVSIWYDQYNGRHLFQTSALNQPVIVRSGTVETMVGKTRPVLDFVASNPTRLFTTSSVFNHPFSFACAFAEGTPTGLLASHIFCRGNISEQGSLYLDITSRPTVRLSSGPEVAVATAVSSTTPIIATGYIAQERRQLRINSQPDAINTTFKTVALTQNEPFHVGSPRAPSAWVFNGKIGEVRIYEQDITEGYEQSMLHGELTNYWS